MNQNLDGMDYPSTFPLKVQRLLLVVVDWDTGTCSLSQLQPVRCGALRRFLPTKATQVVGCTERASMCRVAGGATSNFVK